MKKVEYNDILDFDKIMLQYKTIRTKTKNRKKLVNYEMFLASNILEILNTLKAKEYKHQAYNIFLISHPKYRIIMSEQMTDKIVNHLVSQYILHPIIEPLLIDSNVATRVNKGTSYGLKLALKYINKLKLNYDKVYVLKIDIKKYFFNIDHKILLTKLREIVKDDDLYSLIKNIVDSSDQDYINDNIENVKQAMINKIVNKNIKDKQYHIDSIKNLPYYKKGKGLPIGNLSSQILAIFYLNDVDHFIKEKLKLKYYIRYMDDFLIFHYDKEYLKYCLKYIVNKLKRLQLDINDKTNIYDLNHGASFLGYRFKLVEKKLIIRINNQTKRRIKRKMKNLKKYNKLKLLRVQASYKGYLQFSNCNILKIIK